MLLLLHHNGILSVAKEKSLFFIGYKVAKFEDMKIAEKKRLAFSLYVKSSIKRTQKELAKQVGVTAKTIRKWIDEGEWDNQREAHLITRPQLLQEAYAQLQAINNKIKDKYNNIPTKELSDAKAVIRKEIEAFSQRPIHRYIEVFEDFIEYLQRNSPKDIQHFGELSQDFIAELSTRK